MPYIKVGEEHSADINLYYKDWGEGSPSSSATAGR